MTLPANFWAKVAKTETCWNWTGSLVDGYGRFGSARSAETYAILGTSLAYRIAWEDEHGPVPAGLELDHACNNRACVRPSHLEPVTHEENCRRAAERRTKCRNGHAYTAENRVTQYDKPGDRCLECRRKANRESVRRQRARKIPETQIVPWDVKVWAWANGYAVKRMGTVPRAVVAAYLEAHSLADTG